MPLNKRGQIVTNRIPTSSERTYNKSGRQISGPVNIRNGPRLPGYGPPKVFITSNNNNRKQVPRKENKPYKGAWNYLTRNINNKRVPNKKNTIENYSKKLNRIIHYIYPRIMYDNTGITLSPNNRSLLGLEKLSGKNARNLIKELDMKRSWFNRKRKPINYNSLGKKPINNRQTPVKSQLITRPLNNINRAYGRYGNSLTTNYNLRKQNILKQLNSLPVWNTRRHNRNPNKVAFMIMSGRI
jgi:hypothetical protein